MKAQTPNPYASPSEAAQRGHSAKFTLDDERRKLISSTATLMIVAGTLQLLVLVLDLVRVSFAIDSVISAVMFGLIAAFVAVAGFSLRSAAAEGSVEALLSARHSASPPSSGDPAQNEIKKRGTGDGPSLPNEAC